MPASRLEATNSAWNGPSPPRVSSGEDGVATISSAQAPSRSGMDCEPKFSVFTPCAQSIRR